MDVGIVIFILGFLMIVASIYVYSSKDHSAYQEVLETVTKQQAKIADLDKLISSNILSVGNCNVKCDEVEKKIEKLSESCKDNESSIVNLQVFCTKMKETQIDMQDKISNKRPVLKFMQPVPVEIVDKKGRGVKALIRTK